MKNEKICDLDRAIMIRFEEYSTTFEGNPRFLRAESACVAKKVGETVRTRDRSVAVTFESQVNASVAAGRRIVANNARCCLFKSAATIHLPAIVNIILSSFVFPSPHHPPSERLHVGSIGRGAPSSAKYLLHRALIDTRAALVSVRAGVPLCPLGGAVAVAVGPPLQEPTSPYNTQMRARQAGRAGGFYYSQT